MTAEPPFRRIGDLAREHARARPDAPAVTVSGVTLGWAALVDRAGRVAASLQRDGIVPGQAIAIISYTNTDYVALYLGALMAGVAVAPIAFIISFDRRMFGTRIFRPLSSSGLVAALVASMLRTP